MSHHLSSDNITQQSLHQTVWRLAFPSSCALMGHFLFELVDAYWVGYLGSSALAAVGGSSFYIWAYYSLMGLTTSGINALVAQAVGANEERRAREIAYAGLVFSLLLSVLFAALMLLLKGHLLRFVGLQGEALRLADAYLSLFLWASPIYYTWSLSEAVLSARGRTQWNMMATLISVALNTVLDPYFIHGLAFFPCWGVAGAQVASIVAALVGLALSLGLTLKQGYFRRSALTRSLAYSVVAIGFPKSFSQLIFALVYPALARLIIQFGDEALAAWMICHRLEGLPFFFAQGFSISCATMVGQYIGAQDRPKAQKAVYCNLLYVGIVLGISSIVYIFSSAALVRLFTDDPRIIEYGASYLRIVAYTHLFLGLEVVFEGVFNGMANTLPYMIVTLPLTVARLPLAWLFIPWLGLTGVFWAISLSTLTKGLILYLWFVLAGQRLMIRRKV